MDEEISELEKLEDINIKHEPQSSDEDISFQFEVDDDEYDDVLRNLNAKEESDLDDEINSEIKIECPHEDCGRTFSRKHNLIKHINSHELGLERPGSICHICGKLIKGVYSLHLKVHENLKQFKCDDCGKYFRQKIALNNHLLIHRNEKPHECPWCFKRFRQKYTMKHHMKNRHTGVKEHICDLCGKEFSDRATLQKHSLVHSTSKPHQCSVCFMSFRHKSSLSRHNKIHLKVTQCMHCDRGFRYESFLKKHLLTAHKGLQVSFVDNVKQEIKAEDVINVTTYETVQAPQYVQVDSGSHYYQGQPVHIQIQQTSYSS